MEREGATGLEREREKVREGEETCFFWWGWWGVGGIERDSEIERLS